MRSLIGVVLVLATAVATIGVPLFVGHGIASHQGGPIVYGLAFLVLALLLGAATLWWSRGEARTQTHTHDGVTHSHPHGGPHVH